jgi:hypothetical protein
MTMSDHEVKQERRDVVQARDEMREIRSRGTKTRPSATCKMFVRKSVTSSRSGATGAGGLVTVPIGR